MTVKLLRKEDKVEKTHMMAQTPPPPPNGINFHEKAIYMYLYKNTYSTERHKSQSSLQKKKPIVRLLHSVQNEILKFPFIAAT